MTPETRYAKGPEGHVAYQVLGSGPLDIVFVPDHPSNVDAMWEEPSLARFLTRLSSIGRVICFDKRGTGVSDPVPLGALPTLERWMDDVTTVLDAVGSERVVVLGHGDGGPIALLFAATYPKRTSALILSNTFARFMRAPDYPHGIRREAGEAFHKVVISEWGSVRASDTSSPSQADNPAYRQWRARYERLSFSPGAMEVMFRHCVLEADVRSVLSAIRVPTLVLHSSRNDYVRVGHGRWLAEHIAGARYLELPGRDHWFHLEDSEGILAAVREFVTGGTELADEDRMLATVLFTDLVGATEMATKLGDRAWRDLLERHHAAVRRELARFRGREVDTAGDGFFATFEGPARGVRCALAARDAVRSLGLELRAGVHTGECEQLGEKVGGIAVHIGARIASAAAPGEVLASSTVKDLVAGSGLRFNERGAHALKGVPGEWRLFAAE